MILTECGDDPLLDGPPARSADWNAHLVVAPQAVQLVLKSSKAHHNYGLTLTVYAMMKYEERHHYPFLFTCVHPTLD